MVAVNIFLLLIVNGTKCCLNCLIIRYTKNCPNPETMDIIIKSAVNYKCSHKNITNDHAFIVTIANTTVIIAHHLFIYDIIYVGCGLQSTFIYACKSGRNPQAMKCRIKNRMPIRDYFVQRYFVSGSAIWNIRIPAVIINATIIFLGPSFRFGSCTLEQNTAMNITGKMLHDQNIITTGKLVLWIARVEK